MRSIIKILTLLSLVASIGSFIIAVLPLINGNGLGSGDATVTSKPPQVLVQVTVSDGRRDPQEDAARYCILTMAVCGAGIAIIRMIRMRGPGR